MSNHKPELKQIPVEQLERGEYQPRKAFDKASLDELASSIKSAGLIQPLVIRAIGEKQYEIIAGERRWRAAQIVGLDTVPCLLSNISDEQAAAVTTIENIQRQDLNPIEEAQSFQRLAEEFDYLHEEIAAIVGKSRTKITNTMRLLKLEPRVQDLLINQQLSGGHGKVITGVAEKFQFPLAQKCVEQGWSVRKLETEAKKIKNPSTAIKTGSDPNTRKLEQSASEQFGSPVKLDPDLNQQTGWLKIRYFNNETLAGLLDKIGVEYE